MPAISIAADLKLPVDIVTQTLAILAKRRAGKSYTARRVAEQLFTAGQQIVIVDPKGDWWGIRSSADGKSPGLPVVILGGERGDVPLEVGSGEVVAKLVTEERVSALLDLSLFRKHEVATFMTAFLETLYRLKAQEKFRTPLMLIVDEADAIMPQKPQPNEARMLGAGEDIVRRGGQRGIGCMLITQRSAVLNKNVLTQAEMIVGLRTIAPQDLAALDAWVEVHGEQKQRDTLMQSLPSLPIGDAWFWSPGWPTAAGVFQRVHVLPIETFDSGKSPVAGEKRVEPRNLADIDLSALTRQMAATIENAKANDPRELKKQLAERDKAIRDLVRKAATPPVAIDQAAIARAVDKAVLDVRRAFGLKTAALRRALERLQRLFQDAGNGLDGALEILNMDTEPPPEPVIKPESPTDPFRPRRPERGVEVPPPSSNGDSPLGKGERAVLNAIAQYPDGLDRDQLSVLVGLKRSSRNLYIQKLQRQGCIEVNGSTTRATDLGIRTLGTDYEPLPEGRALRAHWLERLPAGERKVLEAALEAYPKEIAREDIDERVGLKRSTRNLYIQQLQRRRLLVPMSNGDVKASELLF